METAMRDWVVNSLELNARLVADIGANDKSRWIKVDRRRGSKSFLRRLTAVLLPGWLQPALA